MIFRCGVNNLCKADFIKQRLRHRKRLRCRCLRRREDHCRVAEKIRLRIGKAGKLTPRHRMGADIYKAVFSRKLCQRFTYIALHTAQIDDDHTALQARRVRPDILHTVVR